MSAAGTLIGFGERLPLPDVALRAGVRGFVGATARRLARGGSSARAFAATMTDHPIAEHTQAANAQHYELPAAFFAQSLGPRRKYSCCYYATAQASLAEAEDEALTRTCAHAALGDGQTILELGCGWGSLTLWMAERYPSARITAVSNSSSQRAYIEELARSRNLNNLAVVTADMNDFAPTERFDRIVSVEMFEHMANWTGLLRRARDWLEPTGRLFVHVFSHRAAPYRFDATDDADWIARHFFTGGIMPSHDLMQRFESIFTIEDEWRWSGEHYARTARDWLDLFDRNRAAIRPILRQVYGADARLWERRWRLFFLATEGLFGYGGGEPWGVSHYRLRPVI